MRTGRKPLLATALLAVGLALAPAPAFAVTGAPGADNTSMLSTAVASAATAEQAEPDSEAEAGRLAFVLIPLVGAAVVVVGAIVVISRGRRRRRGD
ncbi:hypothetical protein SAMN04487848_1033 [Microbacterium sp. ru370.1]|uniref:hypothetical protein n=1 Tax=unclassified Microbacterium TaxID=2609290 RepID=UPI000890A44B|nr:MULTISPECIES: hypothetical protein [unclassified Microbacterium]SDO46788.1 hypothetical protein SAMN04487848_1033 [Microbacterium sp. ru370.1]SIT81863.1 hypothetical protein SAMN05880579_1029 [Microbacterium sp. RU1D]